MGQTWELKPKIEALLVTSDRPVTIEALASRLDVAKEEVNAALREYEFDLMGADRGMQVRRQSQGIRIEPKPQYADMIGRFLPERKGMQMSTRALETLAIIALTQPVSTGEINATRGIKIKSERVLLTLRNQKLIARVARLGPQRENIWRTTRLFLDTFGLASLDELHKEGRMEEAFRRLRSRLIKNDGAGKHHPMEARSRNQCPNRYPAIRLLTGLEQQNDAMLS